MLQSSITAWLKKPATVKGTGKPTPAQVSASPSISLEPQVHASPPEQNAQVPKPTDLQKASPTNVIALPPLSPNVELVPLNEELMPGFKRLLALTLPISYPPTFFTESMTEPYHSITLMALWHPTPLSSGTTPGAEKPRLIGAIRCRILPSANLYISTISLLAPYRSHGIAAHLLQKVAAKASQEHGVKCITAHVWEANEDGLEWYKKRGFEIIGREDGYYSKLKPMTAILVRKWIGVMDLLADIDADRKFEG